MTFRLSGKTYEHIKQSFEEGAYGEIFLVKDADTDKNYIVKKTRPYERIAEHQKNLAYLEKEYDILTSIKECPNIICVEGFIRDVDVDGEEYALILMEHAKGKDLFDFIKWYKEQLRQTLTFSQFYNYVWQLVTAVQCFHAKHIYHLDIKIENIVFRDTSHTQLAIIDFGLAEYHPDDQCGGKAGTPGCQAEEVRHLRSGQTYACSKSDIYSLSIVFRELRSIAPYYTMTKEQNMQYIDLWGKMNSFLPENRPTIEEVVKSDFFRLNFDVLNE